MKENRREDYQGLSFIEKLFYGNPLQDALLRDGAHDNRQV